MCVVLLILMSLFFLFSHSPVLGTVWVVVFVVAVPMLWFWDGIRRDRHEIDRMQIRGFLAIFIACFNWSPGVVGVC